MGHVGDIGGRGGGGGGRGPGRTGERPALGTGERPALRTGERPALRTGERPALNDRGQPTRPGTGSRPALPAATFADALTQTPDGKLSTAAETLVMPKVEVPPESDGMTRGGRTRERPALKDGQGANSPESSPEAPEGRSVNDMDTPIGRGGGTRIGRMPEAPGGRGRTESTSGGKEARQGSTTELPAAPSDGFGTTPTTSDRPALRSSMVRGPVLPMEDIIPEGLAELGDLEALAKRFASDGALLRQQIRPSSLPSLDRAVRLWAFFTAYAEASAGKDPNAQAEQILDKALKEQGFGEYRDARTGDDGMKAAKWVLASATPEEARERADEVDFQPPPEVLLSESAQLQEGARKPEAPQRHEAARRPEDSQSQSRQAIRDSAFSQGIERPALERVPGHSEFVRVNPQLGDMPRPVIMPPNPDQLRRSDGDSPVSRFEDIMKKLSGNMRLGSNMLWNLLHRSRNGPEDSAIEKEKWNQLVFAAIIAFVGLMLLIILVVAL